MKTYGRIDEFKRMNVKIILNDNQILYEGNVENVPFNIKEMHFNKVHLGAVTEIFIYDEKNK